MPEDSKAVLLLNKCKALFNVNDLVSGEMFTTYLSPNITSLLKPMDQRVIKNFKFGYSWSLVQGLFVVVCGVEEFQAKYNILKKKSWRLLRDFRRSLHTLTY